MAFTREFIRKLAKESEVELPKEFIDGLIAEHTNVRDSYADEQVKAALANQPKPKPTDSEEYKALQKKFDDEKAAHDKLRNGIAEKQTKEAKTNAIRAYYESKNIKGANLEIAMESADKMIGVTEFDENNQITSSTALDELVSGKFSGLVTHEHTAGAQTANPPTGYGGGTNSKSTGRAKILAQQYQENNYGVPKTQNSNKEE